MNALTINEKDAIRDALKTYCNRYPSQNKAAASLRNVSAGTISTILNSKYETISDDMFRNILSQVGTTQQTSGVQIVETTALHEIISAMKDAQEWQDVTWVVGASGCGKTTAAKVYQDQHKEVFTLLCSEDMKKGDFIRELAAVIGVNPNGHNIRETLKSIIARLIQMENPLLIFDEGDKLTDLVFHYFITIYNQLKDRVGIIFLSTSYIKKRMESGLKCNKRGYQEMNSRIGRKFYEVSENTAHDVYAVCLGNGLSDKEAITRIIDDAAEYENDLRRVTKKIRIEKKRLAA
jgi:uncharacterized protein YneF (UPF0154 family)